jgi:hypothetical protein
MHSKGKGMSSSALPYKRSKPSWLKVSADEVHMAAGGGRGACQGRMQPAASISRAVAMPAAQLGSGGLTVSWVFTRT